MYPEHKDNFQVTEDFGKIRCVHTGHEMCIDASQKNDGASSNNEMLEKYIHTNKKYLEALELANGTGEPFDFEGFCKFITPHKACPE